MDWEAQDDLVDPHLSSSDSDAVSSSKGCCCCCFFAFCTQMKHRYNNPRCQDGGSFSLFAEWFRRELHIDVTCLFLPRQFIFYILSSLCVSNVALVFPRSVRLIDSVFSLSCVCVCVCTFPRSRRFKYLCYIPQRSFLWPLIRTVERERLFSFKLSDLFFFRFY